MHKLLIGFLCMAVMVAFGLASGMAGQETGETMCIPMGQLTLKAPETVEAKRSPVDFPHTLHFDFSCMECHHQWEGEESIQSCTTSGCHELDKSPAPDSGDDMIMYYKNAYHKLCLGCHREVKAWNKKVAIATGGTGSQVKSEGPTGCIKCHPK